MSKKEKRLEKQQRNLLKQKSRQAFNLDEAVTQVDSDILDPSVAINDMPDYDEGLKENFLISFKDYNYTVCELHRLDKILSKKLIKKLKYINAATVSSLPNSGLIKDNVEKTGQYEILLKTIPPDAELKEISFSDTARIFAYFIKRYCCIVAIKVKHIGH